MTKSIIQDWVAGLGLRHQGVLVTCLRGCDGLAKEDCTKPLAREMRGLILTPFDERELVYNKGFMVGFPSLEAGPAFQLLLKNVDGYPVHYLMHLIHAIEVIGYHHPSLAVRGAYETRYQMLVRRLHFNPETKEQMDARLSDDRFSKGTVEG